MGTLGEILRSERPPYVTILESVPRFEVLGYGGAALVVGFTAATFMLALALADALLLNVWPIVCLPILLGLALRMCTAGYELALSAGEFIENLVTESERATLRESLVAIFQSKMQHAAGVAMAIFAVAILGYFRVRGTLAEPFDSLHWLVFIVGLVPVAFLAWIGGWGTWEMSALNLLIRSIRRSKDLRINPIAPETTLGLLELRRMARGFAIAYSVGWASFLWPLLLIEWEEDLLLEIAAIPMLMLASVVLIWTLCNLLRTGWVVVRSARNRVLADLEGEIRKIYYNERKSGDDLKRLRELQDVHELVRKSGWNGENLPGFITWASALGLQLPFVAEVVGQFRLEQFTVLRVFLEG